MKRLCLTLSMVVVLASGAIGTASASALTAGQAYTEAQQFADHHFSGGPELIACNPSGKNERGVAQWYCYGYFTQKGGEWKVNVGPYPGEITYYHE